MYKDLKGVSCLVTGGAGFIGSHICEDLLLSGAKVICFDNFSAGYRSNISAFEDNKNFIVIEGDICDKTGELDTIFMDIDIVFNNAASKKNICLINPQRDLDVNAGGTLNLLELSMKHNVKKFVHASTGSVYGEPHIFPTDESHPLSPVSYYGVSKLAGERYVDVFNKLYGLDTTILRYFHVYGPRQESNEFGGVVSIFLKNIIDKINPTIFGDGEQVRSFTWVKDLVKVNLLSATDPISNGKVYNAASGIQVSIKELAEFLLKVLNNDLKIEYAPPLLGDIMKFDVDNSLVCKDLHIQFTKDFFATLELALKDSQAYLSR